MDAIREQANLAGGVGSVRATGNAAAISGFAVRDWRFGRTNAPTSPDARWWANGDPIATAFFNALSVTFPRGEAFFIDSVKAHRDGVPPKLAAEIRDFIRQEVNHTREHVAFNRNVTAAGYDTRLLDSHVEQMLAMAAGRPVILNLAATMALEHFTAMFAHELLADPVYLAGGDSETADMWRWHAIEEIEHKGVAYDTWAHATRDWSRGKRWRVKTLMMLLVTKHFLHHRYLGIIELLRQDGLTGWRTHWAVLRYAFGRPGIVRRIMPAWAAYFMPGFHPWNHDDRALVAASEAALAR